MPGLGERWGDLVVRVNVVGKTVQEDNGRAVRRRAVLEIRDVQNGSLNVNGLYSDAAYSSALGGSHSGLVRPPAKRVGAVEVPRGFESLPLRPQ